MAVSLVSCLVISVASAQDYKPPSLDFDAPAVVETPVEPLAEHPKDVPLKPLPLKPLPVEPPVEKIVAPKPTEKPRIEVREVVPRPEIEKKAQPETELEKKKIVKPKVEEKAKTPEVSSPAIKKAISKKIVKPQDVEGIPLDAIKSSNTASSKDVSLVLTYEEDSSGLTQAQIARLKQSLDGFKAKGKLNIHAYANIPDGGNVGFARSLSLSRALTVREWFVNNGIKAENMTLRALGEARLGNDSVANSVEIFTGKKS